MTTKNLLILTLLATSLTLSATVPTQLTQTAHEQSTSISTQIAATLYDRGLEEKTAHKLTLAMINTDEELFAFMVQNFSLESGLSMDEISQELGKIALNKRKADFSSYSFLIKLAQSIKKESLTAKELQTIENISTKNQMIYSRFS